MKKLTIGFLACFLAWTLCGCAGPEPPAESAQSATSAEAVGSLESIADIIKNSAVSVEYQSADGWIVLDAGTAEGAAFLDRLIAAFPERFSEISAAYEPEQSIIRVKLAESAPHKISVNSNADDTREVEIATIEIDGSGCLFLLSPSGATPLGVIENAAALLTPES